MFLVPRLRLVGAVAALLAAAVILGITAAGRLVAYQSALNLSRSPLAEPPPPGPAGTRHSRRVTLVILDGLREDVSRALPTLAALRLGGADLVADSHFPTLSLPNYVALLSGVPPVWNGVRTNRHPGPVPVDHLFARAHDAGLSVSYLGDRDLSLGKLFPRLDDITLAPRSGSFARAASRSADLNVVLVLYPDDAGHRYGARASEYQSAALAADALLAEVVGAMDLGRDTLVVVSDHGHTRHGGHGGLEDEVRRVPLVLAGAGVRPHAHGVASLVDVAPTLAWLLGIPAPRGAHGSVLVDALALRRDERALAIAGDQARHAWVAAAVRDAQRRDRSRGERTRTERLAWIAAGAHARGAR